MTQDQKVWKCCSCRKPLGVTDGSRLILGTVIAYHTVTLVCATCGKGNVWRPVALDHTERKQRAKERKEAARKEAMEETTVSPVEVTGDCCYTDNQVEEVDSTSRGTLIDIVNHSSL